MKTRVTTVRLPEELAQDAELVARVDGITFSELVRLAVTEHLRARGIDPEFKQRVRARVEADRHILARLRATGRAM